MKQFVISIYGYSKSGKTTLIEKLIPVLSECGFKIAVIKHSNHELSFDKDGKDSKRFTSAGADSVIASSSGFYALMHKTKNAENLEYLLSVIPKDIDIVLIEGFKEHAKNRIVIMNNEEIQNFKSMADDIAVVSPVCDRQGIKKLVDLIVKKFKRYQKKS